MHFKLLEARNYLAVRDDSAFLSSLKDINKLILSGPTLGLDIDGTITDYVNLFKFISNNWFGKVVIITYRKDYDSTFNELQNLGIYFDELILSPTLNKSDIINESGIAVYVDDQDECIQGISPNVLVLKVKNFGNYRDGQWLYSKNTGVCIDE